MKTAAETRAIAKQAKKTRVDTKVNKLLSEANVAICSAADDGDYLAFVNVLGYSGYEILLAIDVLKQLGYTAKKASQEPFIDLSW